MAGTNIRAIERILPQSFDRSYTGVVVQLDSTGALGVTVQGNVLPARWADPVVVVPGDPVLVQISVGKTGQSEAIVRARIGSVPRPPNGTVTATPGGGLVTVKGQNGAPYDCLYVASYTPVIGDSVILSWAASQPCVIGKATIPATSKLGPASYPAFLAPSAPGPSSGTATYVATDSSTWQTSTGKWGTWNGGNKGVYQGGSADPLTGAWFYSGSVSQLYGRTISRIQFHLGERLQTHDYDKPVVVHFYSHPSRTKPAGNVALANGPYDVTAWPGQGLTVYDLPLTFANDLQNGGGIAISTSPYCGFKSRKDQPDSGKLDIDWSL